MLVDGGLVEEGLGKTMVKTAKFGNVVDHHYDCVDAAIVIAILRKHLDEFLHFRDAVLRLIGP